MRHVHTNANVQKKGGRGSLVYKENAVHKLLRKLGGNGGYLGFFYAASAIELVMNNETEFYQCKWLYNEVANQYQTTPVCVERNIRTLVDSIWKQGNRELLGEIIPYPGGKKPKNAQFIDGLAVYLSEHHESLGISGN